MSAAILFLSFTMALFHCKKEIPEEEPLNDKVQSAPRVSAGDKIKGSYYSQAGRDIDFIFLEAPSPLLVKAALSPVKGVDSIIMLFEGAGDLPAKVVDDHLTSLPEAFGPFLVNPPGVWIAVSPKKGRNDPAYQDDYLYTLELKTFALPAIPEAMEGEPNDDLEDANPVVTGEYYGFFNNQRSGPSTEKDLFVIEFSGEVRHRLSVAFEPPPEIDGVLRLYDEKMNPLLTIDRNGKGKPENILSYGVRGAGLKYLSLHAKGGEVAEEPYRLVVESAPYDDRYEFEPNDDLEKATPLRQEVTFGDFSTQQDIDYYYYYNLSTEVKTLSFVLQPSDNFDIRMELVSAAGSRPIVFDSGGEGEAEAAVNRTLKPLDSVYLRAILPKSAGEAAATYRLVFHEGAASQDEEMEPNDEKKFSSPIEPGETLWGYMNPARDIDTFKSGGAGGRYLVQWRAPGGCQGVVRIFDAKGVMTDSKRGQAMGEEFEFPAIFDSGGYVELSCSKSEKDVYSQKYELTITPSSISDQF